MGNCLRRKSSTVWAGDDWEPMAEKKPNRDRQSLLDQRRAFSSSSTSASTSGREVKIKISKKQLEELLGKAEVHNMPVDQILSSLIDASDHFGIQHQSSWRPTLQSIPEVD